jgi:choline kinase
MVSLIKKFDKEADIVVVTGHMHRAIEQELRGVTFIYNPFYEVTNSVSSLWFAREHLEADNVVLINGDIVMSSALVEDVVCKPVDSPMVLLDSSIKTNGDYNVQVSGERVLVMSKDLKEYFGEYAGVTKLDEENAKLVQNEMDSMIEAGFYDQWFENILVELIFKKDFRLYYKDICEYEWTEVDDVGDLIHAKNIHIKELC